MYLRRKVRYRHYVFKYLYVNLMKTVCVPLRSMSELTLFTSLTNFSLFVTFKLIFVPTNKMLVDELFVPWTSTYAAREMI